MSGAFLEPQTLGTIAMCSVRYALGRQTYMASMVAADVAAVSNHLSENDLRVIATDIRQHLSRNPNDFFADCWAGLQALLEERRIERGRPE